MKVLFVCNNIFAKGNGLCTSAQVTVMYLKEAGIDARFLAGANPVPGGPEPDFPLRPVHIPIFQELVASNGFCFAKKEDDVIKKAVEWADIIHLEEPFPLERRVIKFARKMGKPIVGTFHLYPQNILIECPIPIWGWPNKVYLEFWKRTTYKYYSDIQCPTNEVRKLLEKSGIKSRLHVISNGIRITDPDYKPSVPAYPPYMILSTGRFSRVKDQMTLLRSMTYSKFASQIQIYFAGKGSEINNIKKYADELVANGVLKLSPIFAFHTHAELANLAKKSYLYVHAAKLEVEGLGCIEALREGTVPVIAKGDLIGTTDFALDDRSTYEVGNAKQLAERIDWWIEHPEERNSMAVKYADFAKTYDVHNSIEKLIKMYEGALKDRN